MRLAGAQAREMLIAAAAQTWNVEAATCFAEDGGIIHQPTGRRLSYADLAETAATIPPIRAKMKKGLDYTVIGTRVGQLENPDIVEGRAMFGADVMIPNMLFATVARGPVLRSTPVDYDASGAEAVEGVHHILPIDSGIAVVADNTWAAFQGRAALEVTWDDSQYAHLNSETVRQELMDRLASGEGENGNVLQAIYEVPFYTHVTPSPMNSVADIKSDRGEVWAPTQAPWEASSRASSASGLSGDALTVHVPRVGGGFGRRIMNDYVYEASQISKAVGAPVKLVWSREDDIQHGYYHPLSLHRASIDLDSPKMPRIQSQTFGEWSSLTYAWRAVSNFTDAFVRECFLDEMAAALGRDPLELRLELMPGSLDSPRKKVLQLAATKAGWGGALPEGWGRGIAYWSTWEATPVAQVAEISVENGVVKVHRVVCALDCGTVINPDLVEAQMEGGIVWGLSALLKKAITIKDGRVQQSNLHDYPMLSIDEMPAVEVYCLPSTLPPSGVGEMGVPPIAPAVLNGIYAATGKRIRRLPIQPEDLRDI